MADSNQFISLNGKIVLQEDANVPAVQSGLFYGAGCFESFLIEQGRVYRFDEHFNRMISGLDYLGVPTKFHPEMEKLSADIYRLVKKNNLKKDRARIRIQCSLNEQKGYYRDSERPLNQIITCSRFHQERMKPTRLASVNTKVVPAECKPANLKLSNMLHYRNAFREALDAGADDALMLTVDGFIAETSIANIFWKKGNDVYTPSTACDILPGIMRNTLIEILNQHSLLKLIEGEFQYGQLEVADCIWLTNSVREILPVQSVNGKEFRTDDPVFELIRVELNKMKQIETGE
ncbi:MAG: aminotransferase class IV [Balneolaceae bacterium]|nr:aminotransferase class IV [Balneolaceae bacterium]